MKLRTLLHNKKTKIRMNKYSKQIFGLGEGCYIDGDVHFGGCKKALSIGNNTRIGPFSSFHVQKINGVAAIKIGDNVFINRGFFLDCNESQIEIGNNVTIGCNVTLLGTNHDINDLENFYTNLIDKPVIIGAGTWIGTRVIILPGVRLGENCIVGAGSVVTKSFDDFSMIAGNPAKLIKKYDKEKKVWVKVN